MKSHVGHRNIIFHLSDEQAVLLKEISNSNMKLSNRQSYVLKQVLDSKTYHENHQYQEL